MTELEESKEEEVDDTGVGARFYEQNEKQNSVEVFF